MTAHVGDVGRYVGDMGDRGAQQVTVGETAVRASRSGTTQQVTGCRESMQSWYPTAVPRSR